MQLLSVFLCREVTQYVSDCNIERTIKDEDGIEGGHILIMSEPNGAKVSPS
jgi:hypothetical protein